MKVTLPSDKTLGSSCEECPCYRRLHFQVDLDTSVAPILFLLDVPSTQDGQTKKYLSGSSGNYYRDLIRKAGIKENEYKVSALGRCQPKSIKGTNIFAIASCCEKHLIQDIKNALIIVPLGPTALKWLTGLNKILLRRGSIYKVDNKYVVPCIPPLMLTTALHAMKKEGKKKKQDKVVIPPPSVVIEDLIKIKKLLNNTIDWDIEPEYNMQPSYVDKINFVNDLWREPKQLMAIDIETTFDGADDAVPEIIAFSTDRDTFCVNFEDDLEFIANCLISPVPKIFQNGLFDMRVLNGIGLDVVNYAFDTMYSHHLLFAELSHKLGFIQSVYTTIPYHKDMVNLKDKEDFLEER